MMNHKRIRLTKLAFALSLALASAHGVAQNTTSAINGRITDASGKPAGGAQVTIVHTESGSVSNVTTDAAGNYAARGLRPGGPYTITVTKNGVTERRENVFLNLAEAANVDAQLGAPVATVTITGSAGGANDKFNRSAMGAGTAISRTELAAQASINRNLQDYARIDPRVAQTDKDRGEISVAGQNSRFNTITVDGVGITDTFGLAANGLPTARQPISIDSIQSVQVNVSNYDVTQKGYVGANINAVTKSGTNVFHGSLYSVYRDDSMAGDRYTRSNDTFFAPPTFKEQTNGFTLGGPILKDKLFFFASIEDFKSTRDAPAFGPLGSPLTQVGITPEAITQANAIAAARYPGLLVGTMDLLGTPQLTMRDKLLKLDWNINDNHRAFLRYEKVDQRDPNFGSSSTTSLALNSQWRTDVTPVETLVANLTSDWTDDFSTEFKISRRKTGTVPENNSTEPAIGLSFTGPLPATAGSGVASGSRFLNFGTDISRQFNILRTTTIDAYLGATYRRGDHEIKFGGDYSKNDVYNAFLQRVFGTYTFACIDASNNLTYNFNGNVNTFRCNTASADAIQAAVLENFQRGRPQQFQVQTPAPGKTFDNSIAQFTLKNTGLFLQDTWTVNNRLTVNGGVRMDMISIPERPTANAAAAAPVVAGNVVNNPNGTQTYTRQTGGFGYDNTVTPDGKKLFQPRVGFNYRFETELPSQLRGGVGLFQGAAMNVWLGNPFQNAGLNTRTIACNTSSPSASTPACPTTDGFFQPNPNAQPTSLGGTPATPTIKLDLLSPDLRQPAVYKLNLGYEKTLPWGGIVMGLEYLRTDVQSGLYYKHLNLGAPTRIGPDGRELFYTYQGYNPACFSTTGGTSTSGACAGLSKMPLANSAYNDVIIAEKTSKGGGNVATVSLSKALSKGFGWSLSYTYTEATEVSNLTSSTSASQWNTRSNFNPNEDALGNSAYLVKDRFSGSLTWQKAFFGNYKTTIGAFLESRSGRPFSWVYSNDMNGDGVNANDLLYIPSAPGSGEVVFQGDTATSKLQEARFWAFVESEPSLMGAKGSVVKRNNGFSAWTNTLDMRISQEIPGFFKGHKGVFTLDLMNVGNMLNKRWGLIEEVSFPQRRSFVAYAGIDPTSGKYVYAVLPTMTQPIIKQNKGESQWAVQATARYEF